MTNKKSSFFRFLFSLIPGAGEMYMGFLKMGVSLMSLFVLIFFLAGILGIGPLIIINIIVWFYSFFHVHNLASMPDEEFYSVEDQYLFCFHDPIRNKKDFFGNNRQIIAGILIFSGVILTWRGFLDLLSDILPGIIYEYVWKLSYELPRIFVGIVIIILGTLMIRGKKKELDDLKQKEAEYEKKS